MAITHVEGDFGPEHFSKEFGFHGSTTGQRSPAGAREDETPANARVNKKSAVPFDSDEATTGDPAMSVHKGGVQEFSHGGHMHPHGHEPMHTEPHMGGHKIHHRHGGHSIHHPDGHVTHHHHDGTAVHSEHMAHGGMEHHMHPHGHHVTHVEHKSDGRIIMHHAHGGHSVMHPHGHMSHHMADGSPAHMAHGGVEGMHDASEFAHRAKGGHMEHEEHDARGGMAGHRQRLPRAMKPPGMRPHSPIETPPRDPGITTTPRNQMSGGAMGMGVEPSAEPDTAGDGQGIPQMKRGGHHRA